MKTAAYLLLGIGWSVLVLATAGCTHIAGRVVWAQSDLPVSTAALSVGPPASAMSTDQHQVTPDGRFDFWINPLDVDDVWIWSGLGDPALNSMHIDSRHIGDHMLVKLPAQLQTAPSP